MKRPPGGGEGGDPTGREALSSPDVQNHQFLTSARKAKLSLLHPLAWLKSGHLNRPKIRVCNDDESSRSARLLSEPLTCGLCD